MEMSFDSHCNGKSRLSLLLDERMNSKMSEYFNLPDFNNDLLNTAHSVQSVKPALSPVQPVQPYTRYSRYSRYTRYTRYNSSSRILTAIVAVEGGYFDVDVTSYIKAPNTYSDDTEDKRKT